MTGTLRRDLGVLGIKAGAELPASALASAIEEGFAEFILHGGDVCLTLFRIVVVGAARPPDDEWLRAEWIVRDSEEAFVWWSDEANDRAVGQFFDGFGRAEIPDWLAGEFFRQGWGVRDFAGTKIANFAPDMLPREFFRRLLVRAELPRRSPRHDDEIHSVSTETWLRKHYSEPTEEDENWWCLS